MGCLSTFPLPGRVPSPSSYSLEQTRHSRIERLGKGMHRCDGEVLLATLHRTDIGPVQAADGSELLL